jgi:hypothetical protein
MVDPNMHHQPSDSFSNDELLDLVRDRLGSSERHALRDIANAADIDPALSASEIASAVCSSLQSAREEADVAEDLIRTYFNLLQRTKAAVASALENVPHNHNFDDVFYLNAEEAIASGENVPHDHNFDDVPRLAKKLAGRAGFWREFYVQLSDDYYSLLDRFDILCRAATALDLWLRQRPLSQSAQYDAFRCALEEVTSSTALSRSGGRDESPIDFA